MQNVSRAVARFLAAFTLGAAFTAQGQSEPSTRPIEVVTEPDGTEAPSWARNLAKGVNDPDVVAYRELRRKQIPAEKEMYRIRGRHFNGVRNVEIRQAGIDKIRAFDDPDFYPCLIEIFEGRGRDVEDAILDIFFDAGNDLGDATLAWVAVSGKTQEFRTAAASRLLHRTGKVGRVSDRIKLVVMSSLRGKNESRIIAAAQLSQVLGLFEAIPWLISAQVTGAQVNTGGPGRGDLAWILVGTQTAFVSDLTPVVGESSVAFDPQLDVITEGSLLRIHDAVAVIYRREVNAALIDLSTRLTGRPTRDLGWNVPAWWDWYRAYYVPWKTMRDAEELARLEREAREPR